jgi:hypothetical protein
MTNTKSFTVTPIIANRLLTTLELSSPFTGVHVSAFTEGDAVYLGELCELGMVAFLEDDLRVRLTDAGYGVQRRVREIARAELGSCLFDAARGL